MKKTAVALMGLALAVAAVSSAHADDDQAQLENECRQVGEQHGITAERMPEWINRCMENIRRLQKEREQQHGQHNDGAHGDNHGGGRAH